MSCLERVDLEALPQPPPNIVWLGLWPITLPTGPLLGGSACRLFHPALHPGPAQDSAFVQSPRRPLNSGDLTASTAAPQTLRTRGLGVLNKMCKHTTSPA